MYTRKGYISLARLWRFFEKEFLPLCKRRSLEWLQADPNSSEFLFGTALDLCEDVFLRSFEPLQMSLVPLQGEIVQIEPTLLNPGAKLLLKLTAFESAHVSILPDEAGPDGKWLKQMGSTAFRPADFGWLYPGSKGRDIDSGQNEFLLADVFNTLPVLFERPTFVVAHEMPPWSKDLLADSYVRNVWPGTRGSAICVSEEAATGWKKALNAEIPDLHLKELIHDKSVAQRANQHVNGGRPRKLDGVIRAYLELGLLHEALTQKEELRRIEAYLDDQISPSTLVRAKHHLAAMPAEGNNTKGRRW